MCQTDEDGQAELPRPESHFFISLPLSPPHVGSCCLFSACQPDLHETGFQILGFFLTYLGDRLVRSATWDDAITERYLNVKVYVSTTGTPTWHHMNSPGEVRWSHLSRFNEQKSFTASISLASTSFPFFCSLQGGKQKAGTRVSRALWSLSVNQPRWLAAVRYHQKLFLSHVHCSIQRIIWYAWQQGQRTVRGGLSLVQTASWFSTGNYLNYSQQQAEMAYILTRNLLAGHLGIRSNRKWHCTDMTPHFYFMNQLNLDHDALLMHVSGIELEPGHAACSVPRHLEPVRMLQSETVNIIMIKMIVLIIWLTLSHVACS